MLSDQILDIELRILELKDRRDYLIKRRESINRMKVVDLKKEAYNRYIVGYSKMRKDDLVKAVESRESSKLLWVNNDIFNKIGGFLEKKDILLSRRVCKTMKKRIYVSKKDIKWCKNGGEDMIYNVLEKMSDLRSDEEKKGRKYIDKIDEMLLEYGNDKLFMSVEKTKGVIVRVVRMILGLNDRCSMIGLKLKWVDSMYKFLCNREKFLKDHKVFYNTMMRKLDELSRNTEYSLVENKKYKGNMLKYKSELEKYEI